MQQMADEAGIEINLNMPSVEQSSTVRSTEQVCQYDFLQNDRIMLFILA